MKRYAIAIRVNGLESESGKRVDDVRVWRGGIKEITVTEEFLQDGHVGKVLESIVWEEIAKHEEG